MILGGPRQGIVVDGDVGLATARRCWSGQSSGFVVSPGPRDVSHRVFLSPRVFWLARVACQTRCRNTSAVRATEARSASSICRHHGRGRRGRRFPAPPAARSRRSSTARCGTAGRLWCPARPDSAGRRSMTPFWNSRRAASAALRSVRSVNSSTKPSVRLCCGENRIGPDQQRRSRCRPAGNLDLSAPCPPGQHQIVAGGARSPRDRRTAASRSETVRGRVLRCGSNAAKAAFSSECWPSASAMITGWADCSTCAAHLAPAGPRPAACAPNGTGRSRR